MTRLLIFVIYFLSTCLVLVTESEAIDESDDFEFKRTEPASALGITTKIIAHIHRPEKSLTETWRFNREFTPPEVVTTLNSVCSDELIDKKLKWNNCNLNSDGLKAELTYGVPEPKNKTLQYLEMKYKPFMRIVEGMTQDCMLHVVPENPVYFLLETFSKLPANDSFPRKAEESVDTVHQHQLGKFGPEFLSIYGESIEQDNIYNFDRNDYFERDQVYECFLAIGSSASVSVIEQKCPINCEAAISVDNYDDELHFVHQEL